VKGVYLKMGDFWNFDKVPGGIQKKQRFRIFL
jgi:hypothetical protein